MGNERLRREQDQGDGLSEEQASVLALIRDLDKLQNSTAYEQISLVLQDFIRAGIRVAVGKQEREQMINMLQSPPRGAIFMEEIILQMMTICQIIPYYEFAFLQVPLLEGKVLACFNQPDPMQRIRQEMLLVLQRSESK